MNFGGVLTDVNGKPLTGVVGVTFYLYQEQQGGAPLWMETQNVLLDKTGHYTVALGSTSSYGLPTDIFVAGEARWLGLQVQGQPEQPRFLLLSVPYALKAGDAETLGGKPASAYALAGAAAVLAPNSSAPVGTGIAAQSSVSGAQPPTTCASVTSDGTATVNALAKFTTPCNVENSVISDTSGNIGIGGTYSSAKLYVTDSPINFGSRWLQRGVLISSATSNGTNSGLGLDVDTTNMSVSSGVTDSGYRLALRGSAYANTTSFAGTLASQIGVYGSAGISQAKSGAKVNSAFGGEFTILNNVPGTAIGSAYGVYISNAGTAGTITNRYDLYASSANAKNYFAGTVGIGTTSPGATLEVNGTAKFDSTVTFSAGQTFPGSAELTTANTFTGNQTVNGNVSATGVVTGSSFEIGSNLFAFGSYANENAFLGFAGNTTMTGQANTAGGVKALTSNTSGFANTANGYGALHYNSTGSDNTASGYGALYANTSGYENTASGFGALYYNTTGFQNAASGSNALYFNTTGYDNTASGNGALQANISGNSNTASGFFALLSNTTGNSNTATGSSALLFNTTGFFNTATGSQALQSNTTADYNTATGNQALFSNTTGNSNTASGFYALYSNVSGIGNTADGADALSGNTSGTGNTASGDGSMFYNTTGGSNTATGNSALLDNTLGNENTASGFSALSNNTTGNDNTASGIGALESNTTGSYNTALGYLAGPDSGSPDLTNATAIGAYATVSASNALILGSINGVNGAQSGVNVGIGTATPTNVFTVAQNAGHAIADAWDTYSSRRWKTNIQPLRNALGVVEQLRGVSYDLKDSGKHEIGVIAEEVGQVVPEVVSFEPNGKDARGVDYSRLTALLIEATKEQQQEIQREQAQLTKALRQIRQEEGLIRAQSAAMRSLEAEVRETRETLRKVKAQVAATQPALVAVK
jgi:hypothetical protein